MKFTSKIIIGAMLIGMSGCKNFQELALDDNDKPALDEPVEVGIPANQYRNGMLFDFAGPIDKWWVANSKLSRTRVGDTLKVTLQDCGRAYECWGTELDDLLDFSKASVLKVTARSEGRNVPMLGISLKDVDGYDTSLDRPSNRIDKGDYEEYYFNYTGKWKHWEGHKPVNPSAIIEILFFVNPGQMNWTGTIYIDDIQVITEDEMPSAEELKKRRLEKRKLRLQQRQQQQEQEQQSEEPKTNVEEKKAEEVVVAPKTEEVVSNAKSEEKIEDKPVEQAQAPEYTQDNVANVDSEYIIKKDANTKVIDSFEGELKRWWTSNDKKIQLTKVSDKLEVNLNGVGPAFETFGRSFSQIDFTDTPVLKVRFKAEGDHIGDLRVDIKDVNGFTTNSKPNVKVFNSGTEFVDFYYDYTGKFNQTFPDVQRVNPANINEVVLFVNPGGKPFSGKLIIDEITTISLEEFNKVKK